MFDRGSVRICFTKAVLRFARIAAAEIRLRLAEDGKNHPSGSDSQVGDKIKKTCKKVARIYFANKTNVKNAPKHVIKVHFIW